MEAEHAGGVQAGAPASVICTLAEGTYHLGVMVLINSLYATGYRGEIWVGYRGEVPSYGTSPDSSGRVNVCDGLIVRLVHIKTSHHLAHFKPKFMLDVLQRTRAGSVFYFDPDIVNRAHWSFYLGWVNEGVALCEDCTFPHFPADHPFRHSWADLGRVAGFTEARSLNRYYNSGFAGVSGTNRRFLEAWGQLIEASVPAGANLNTLKGQTREHPFQVPDQDTFNVAAMVSGEPLSTIGPEAMGFIPGGYVMEHAVDSPKPWVRHYLRRFLLTGERVSPAHRAFWRHVDGPLHPFPRWQTRWRRITLLVVTALGRFYRR